MWNPFNGTNNKPTLSVVPKLTEEQQKFEDFVMDHAIKPWQELGDKIFGAKKFLFPTEWGSLMNMVRFHMATGLKIQELEAKVKELEEKITHLQTNRTNS